MRKTKWLVIISFQFSPLREGRLQKVLKNHTVFCILYTVDRFFFHLFPETIGKTHKFVQQYRVSSLRRCAPTSHDFMDGHGRRC